MTLKHLRSSTLNKRPQPSGMADGQLAINTASGSPGLFFKDADGSLVKIGPVHVGTVAPNVSPASGGTAGNSLGEQWLDTSGGTYVFKIWDGTAWRSESGEFVNASGDTMTGSLTMGSGATVIFEGTVVDGNKTTLTATNPTGTRTIVLPDVSGDIVTTGDSGTITSTMILDGTILNADVNASAAIAGTKISPDFGSQNIVTSGTTTAASFIPSSSGVPTNGIYLPSGNTVGIATSSNERARIDSSGRLLVGTSSDVTNGLLQVEATSDTLGTIRRNTSSLLSGPALQLRRSYGTSVGSYTAVPTDGNCGYLQFFGSTGAADAIVAQISAAADGQTLAAGDNPGRLVFSTTADGASSPTERMKIDRNGILFSVPTYNDTTTSAANIFVSSSGRMSRSTSSLKYKTDVETLQDSYADAVLNCRPVWYRSTTGNDNPEWGWWGFIAEEVAAIDPRLVHWKTVEVTYNENGSVVEASLETPEPEGVQYDRFVPHLLNLIKRQREQIEAMETRLTALESA